MFFLGFLLIALRRQSKHALPDRVPGVPVPLRCACVGLGWAGRNVVECRGNFAHLCSLSYLHFLIECHIHAFDSISIQFDSTLEHLGNRGCYICGVVRGRPKVEAKTLDSGLID